MSRLSWVFSMWAVARRFCHDVRAAAAVDTAFILPILLLLSFAILELTVLAFEYHRASEATRRGARVASMNNAIPDLSGLSEADPSSVCKSTAGTITCTRGTVESPTTFDNIVAPMQAILTRINPTNIRVTYTWSGLGDPTTPGGIKPFVTVGIVGLSYDFLVIDVIPGMPSSITFPPFSTTQMTKGL